MIFKDKAMIILIAIMIVVLPGLPLKGDNFCFKIFFPKKINTTPLDGRVLLMISTNNEREPRFQIRGGLKTQLIFGIDAEGLKPGEETVIDRNVFGYPVRSISLIPAGKYRVQALFHKYETFHRSDGHTVKLPMDRGEGQHWHRAPGNLYSTPKEVFIDPNQNKTIKIILNSA